MTFIDGFNYFFRGLSLLKTKGLKRYVVLPLMVNVVLFASAFYWISEQLEQWQASIASYFPSWLAWLTSLLLPIVIVVSILTVYFLFTSLANWISAPFNGVLSDKVEAHMTGATSSTTLADIVKDIPRVLYREWQKLMYFVPRLLLVFPLLFILPVAGQVIWFGFTVWMLCIQYNDYPFDNNKHSFKTMRNALSQHLSLCMGFGTAITLFTFIPVVNFIVMPAAVCGATIMWVEHFKQHQSVVELVKS